ncbi:MAG: DNA polymerase III subunit gamma/tau [Pyrinomonadaceae bacterium]
MSYQVIARKWRPQTFEEVTGQEAITRTLRNAIEHDRLHHAYIFSGSRGVGKTTTARLLAKALNCRKTDKPNPTPCAADDPNACVSCKEISESRSIDVLEFDAASHTGVDDVREIIIESININPARDRNKIFIIDEVHMLSNSSFNALLKTLEEPPPNVAFIMATTELHKLPDTILSRCQEFQFRTIPLNKIFDRLKIIAEAEKIDISDKALREIARTGEGSMRDAQSNFDQVISFSGEKIDVQDVSLALGIASAEMLTQTVQAIADNKPAEALKVVDELIGRGQDLRNFCRDLLSFFRDLLVFKMAGDAENLLDTAVLSRAELQNNSAPFSEADLIRFFNSLSETESKLREATQPRYVLEVGLVKLIEMRRVTPVEKLLERLAKLENALVNGNLQTENSDENKFAAPAVEKKTLTVDFPLDEVPFPVSPVAVSAKISTDFDEPKKILIESETKPPEILQPNIPNSNNNENIALKMIESMPIKLPPIDAEELEHIEDTWLDDAFERRLQILGDDLSPIPNASKLVEILLGEDFSNQLSATIEISSGAATAFAPAKEPIAFVPPGYEEEISEEIPELSENPTDEELWKYAENHPLAKKVLRIFRGKIVEVKKV